MPLRPAPAKLVTATVAVRSLRPIERVSIPGSFTCHEFPLLQEPEPRDCHCNYQAETFHSLTLRHLPIPLDAVTVPSIDDFLSIIGDDADLEYLGISQRTGQPLLRTLVIEGEACYIENFLHSPFLRIKPPSDSTLWTLSSPWTLNLLLPYSMVGSLRGNFFSTLAGVTGTRRLQQLGNYEILSLIQFPATHPRYTAED